MAAHGRDLVMVGGQLVRVEVAGSGRDAVLSANAEDSLGQDSGEAAWALSETHDQQRDELSKLFSCQSQCPSYPSA